MITTIVRCFIVYVLILFVFRLMGKRQIAQMQPFEFVLTLIIADLATIPMAEMSVPLLNGAVPLLTLVVFHFILTTLTRFSNRFSQFISGKPVIVIDQNGIVYDSLKKLNITLDDLFESVRGAGYFSFSEVQYAIIETNGKVSVMPKQENSPATKEDINAKIKNDSLPLTIISEGNFMQENLKLSEKDEKYFVNILKKEKISSIKKVLILTLTQNGEIYLQEKQKPCKVLNVG